jgi:metal-responsive CopG/Arc/MetJ family transcriptional regulator
MKHYTATGLSLPNELIQKIDVERGDISRSRFLLRIIEKAYNTNNKKVEGQSHPARTLTNRSRVNPTAQQHGGINQ